MIDNFDMKKDVIKVEELSYSVDDKKLIDKISLSVEENEFVGLIGPNGSGKSTLLKNIYKQYKSDSGRIWIQSRPLENLKHKELAKMLSVVTQENSIEFDFSIDEMIQLSRIPYRDMWNSNQREDRLICEAALEKVKLSHMRNRSFLSLSGGEKQRVFLAMAFAQQTDIIVLDEPTNHLDIGYQFMILEMLKAEKHITKFTSFHDMNLALQFCDKIIVLNKGELVTCGKPREVITPELLRDVFHVEAQIRHEEGDMPMHVVYKQYKK